MGKHIRQRQHDAEVVVRQGAYLPHWTGSAAIYAVTFRLNDSLPQTILDAWLDERRSLVSTAIQMGRLLSIHEEKRLHELHSRRIEKYLDAGHGECRLRDPAIAKLVADAVRHFEGQRYSLHAWCVMPNHVHAIVEPLIGHELHNILHSWKSFTAKTANRVLKRNGTFWQAEYYDHLIRNEEDYAHALCYLLENPTLAGLRNWPWVGTGAKIASVYRGVVPPATKSE